MNRTTRWAAAVFVAVAPLAGITYAYPEWPTDAGLDLWNAPTLRTEIEEQLRQREALEAKARATTDRLARKFDVALELVERRMTLAQAARECRAINAGNPQLIPIMRYSFPGATDDELHTRNTIMTAACVLERRSDRVEVLDRLNAELERLRQEGNGRIVLADD